MNLGALEVQIFVSLSLVLGAILVAFVCDFLKGNNESLRERNIELRVRQEERERYQQATPRPTPRATEAQAPPLSPADAEQPPPQPVGPEKPSEADAWASLRELDEAEEIATNIRSRVEPENVEPKEFEPEKPADQAHQEKPDAKAETERKLERPVIEEGTPVSPPPAMSAKVTPIDRLVLESASAKEAMRLAEELANSARVTADAVEDLREELGEEPEFGVEIEDIPQEVEEAADQATGLSEEETEQQIEEDAAAVPALLRGMVSPEEFSVLSDRTEKFRGAVVAIGINGRDAASEEARQADMLMESLLNHDSLGCRIAEDEYILVFPGEDGAAGQRRFQQVSQRLWDHQIRTVASGSITFSWGAMETSRMSLSSTVASARERLEQTRRHREHAPNQIQNFRLIKG